MMFCPSELVTPKSLIPIPTVVFRSSLPGTVSLENRTKAAYQAPFSRPILSSSGSPGFDNEFAMSDAMLFQEHGSHHWGLPRGSPPAHDHVDKQVSSTWRSSPWRTHRQESRLRAVLQSS